MRQVFSSPRLETVEGVAALLHEHGIETRVTDGRSYKGNRRRSFSYRDNEKETAPQAAVWIVHSEDQPRARSVLRDAGLMDSTRDSFLPEPAFHGPPPKSPTHAAARIRLVLLGTVVLLAVITTSRGCHAPSSETAPEPVPETAPEQERHIVPVEVSLD
ncbi:pathogenicity-like protein [Xanthomonadaceae bacterium JHOS43]|nr:pathogenicity-like protein [Xanthomonadaceae bacterium JHOS43]MCX7563343.1 pathogenicity-like protein [Xanthomonadaceae bacterium XH05]